MTRNKQNGLGANIDEPAQQPPRPPYVHRMFVHSSDIRHVYDDVDGASSPHHLLPSLHLFSSFPPFSLCKNKKKREKRKKNSFPPFLERESGSIERENAEAEKLGLDLGVVVCCVWRAVCDLFFAIEESGSLLEFPERFCPFLFSFFLGCFGLGSGEEEI